MRIRMTKTGPIRILPVLLNLPKLLLNLIRSLGLVNPFGCAILPSRAADVLRIGIPNLDDAQPPLLEMQAGRRQVGN